jgi:site-specific DNA-methyltransferase (adenine-specific)
VNTLYYGDNLPILREHIQSESIDLIYLDPPFNSNRSYNVLFKDESGSSADAQIAAFDDTWHWGPSAEEIYNQLVTGGKPEVGTMISALRQFIGENQMMAYLVMMAARLVELHRVLKPTGSLYLHCDPTASHYLKIILDSVFGAENFRNEVIWKRQSAHSGSKKWGDVHDIIFFYSKSGQFTWNITYQEYEETYLDVKYHHEDARGKYRLSDLTGAGSTSGDSSKPWKGIDPSEKGRHWAVPKEILDLLISPENTKKLITEEKLDLLDANGYIYWTPKGKKGGIGLPQYKRYLSKGIPIQDTIIDIFPINSQAKERLGYPTQKPLALLERIIQASSKPGDLVLDPFSGCGTAISAAQKLGRQWIGIDITYLAIAMHKSRLKDMFNLEPKVDYQVIGEPMDHNDAHQLAHDDRYQFQWWALSTIQAMPLGGQEGKKEGKKGADRGIDGVINFIDDPKGKLSQVLVQVKSGGVNSSHIRDLRGVIERENAAMGVFITLEPPTGEMKKEAVSAGFYTSPIYHQKYPRLQILCIEDLLKGEKVKMPPTANTFKKAERVKKVQAEQAALDLDSTPSDQ